MSCKKHNATKCVGYSLGLTLSISYYNYYDIKVKPSIIAIIAIPKLWLHLVMSNEVIW